MADNKKSAPKLIYESQESLYAKAVKMMEADGLIVQFAYKRENYLKAAEMFKEVGDYQDAAELEKKCRELAEQTREDEKEYRYQLAMTQEEDAKSAKGYEKAAKMFRSISEYKDSETQWKKCLYNALKLKKKRIWKWIVGLCICGIIVAMGICFFESSKWDSLKREYLKRIVVDSETSSDDAMALNEAMVGNLVDFGNYKWYVLENGDGWIKLIVAQAENHEEFRHTPFNSIQESVTWEDSSLRNWLNGEFLTENFSEEEQSKIMTTTVKNSKNHVYNTFSGDDTQDKVWILSTAEAVQYKEILKRVAKNMWLRTSGKWPDTAAFMNSTTAIMDYGYPVSNTNFYTCPVICVETQ